MGQGTRDGAGLSVRAMVSAVAQLGRQLTKSQVHRDYAEGAPKTVGDYLAWRTQHRDVSRSAEGRIDRSQPVSTRPGRGIDPPQGPVSPAADDESAAGTSAPEDPAETPDENTEAFRRFRADNERIKNERGRLDLERERGSLVEVHAVEDLQFTAARIVRDRVLMVPARASADLHALLLMQVPEEYRADLAKRVSLQAFEQRLEDLLRDALTEAAKAVEQAMRDDDDEEPA